MRANRRPTTPNSQPQSTTNNLVHHFFRLLVQRHGELLIWRGVHRYGNPLHSRRGGREAVPAALFGDEVHKKHLSIDFESQFASSFLGPGSQVAKCDANWGRVRAPTEV